MFNIEGVDPDPQFWSMARFYGAGLSGKTCNRTQLIYFPGKNGHTRMCLEVRKRLANGQKPTVHINGNLGVITHLLTIVTNFHEPVVGYSWKLVTRYSPPEDWGSRCASESRNKNVVPISGEGGWSMDEVKLKAQPVAPWIKLECRVVPAVPAQGELRR